VNAHQEPAATEGTRPIIPISLIIAAFLGLLLVIYLIIESGAADVAHAMLVIGWWLLPITLFHLLPLVFSALSWRELLPVSTRPGSVTVIWIRWIRESINSLLPVVSIGGDIASVRLAHLRGVPGAQAAASMVVDTTVGAATQLLFVMSGVVLLLTRSTEPSAIVVAWAVLIGIAVLLAAIAAFLLFQHRGLFVGSAKLAHRLLPIQWLSALTADASAIDDAVVAAYRMGSVMRRASVLRLIGWAAGAGEVWLVMQALGQPIGIIDAFILESLASGVRAAAFMVPGALGALEGGFVLFGALFGLPPETALAISLSKRVRELALGLPGLFVWHWIEAHYLLTRSAETRAAAGGFRRVESPSLLGRNPLQGS
jgi:putative membrane protein